MSKVYIILVNYLGANDTIACLESILKMNYSNFHVIVVDNCSTDDSINVIKNWADGTSVVTEYNHVLEYLIKPIIEKPFKCFFHRENDLVRRGELLNTKSLTIIQSISNRGFSAGNNIGLRYALHQKDADYYWLLNNDTLVTSNSLSELVKCHQQVPKEKKWAS